MANKSQSGNWFCRKSSRLESSMDPTVNRINKMTNLIKYIQNCHHRDEKLADIKVLWSLRQECHPKTYMRTGSYQWATGAKSVLLSKLDEKSIYGFILCIHITFSAAYLWIIVFIREARLWANCKQPSAVDSFSQSATVMSRDYTEWHVPRVLSSSGLVYANPFWWYFCNTWSAGVLQTQSQV